MMSKVILWSDLHLGHASVTRWRTQFKTAEEHHETIFEGLISAVNKRDVLYLLGDIAFDQYWLQRVAGIKCAKKVAILGNHDTEGRGDVEGYHYAAVFDEIHSLFKKRTGKGLPKVWLSHAPIHPQELRGCINIHGHTHYNNIKYECRPCMAESCEVACRYEIKDPRYINICPEQTDWKPVVFQELLKRLRV